MILKKQKRGANTNDYEVNFVNVVFKPYAVTLPLYDGTEYNAPSIRDVYGNLLQNAIDRLKSYIGDSTDRKNPNIKISNSLVDIEGNLIGMDTVFGLSENLIEYQSKALFKRNSKFKLEEFKEKISHNSVVSRIGDNILQIGLLYESLTAVQKKYPQGLKIKAKLDQLFDLPFFCLRLPLGFIGCPSSNHDFLVSGYVNPMVSTSTILGDDAAILPDNDNFFMDYLVYNGDESEKNQILPKIEKAFNESRLDQIGKVCSPSTVVRKVKFDRSTIMASPLIVDMLRSLSPFMIGNPHLFASLTATKYFSVDEQIIYNIRELGKKLGLSKYDSLDLVNVDIEYSANSFESVLRDHISKYSAYIIDRLIVNWLSDLDGGIKCKSVESDEVAHIPHLVELIVSSGYVRWNDNLEVQYNNQWYIVSEETILGIFGPLDVESGTSKDVLSMVFNDGDSDQQLKEELVTSLRDIINLLYILNSDVEDVSTVMIGTEINFSLPSKVIRNSSHYGIYKGNRVQE